MMLQSKKVIFLIDMDSFFASCEMNLNPGLAEKPIAVALASKRSIITAANYKSREYGVKAGMPVYKALELCKNLIIVEPHYDIYSKLSNKIFNFIADNFTKKMEVASIDECYLDVTDIYKNYSSTIELAKTIKDAVFKFANITCSIGISDNKLLAKMAVEKNKPNGVTLWKQEHITTFLWNLPIEKLYGVGLATHKKLRDNFNVTTIGDLAKVNIDSLIKTFGKIHGTRLKLSSLGLGDNDVNASNNDFKSIGNELTLDYPTEDKHEITSKLRELCKRVHLRAQERMLKGKTIVLTMREYIRVQEGNFNKVEHRKHKNYSITLDNMTNNYEIIFANVNELFLNNWEGEQLGLIGVRLENVKLDLNDIKQIDIYDIQNEINLSDNEILLNKFNIEFGENVLLSGSKIEKMYELNPTQRKYLDTKYNHLSDKDILKIWEQYYHK